MKRFLPLTAVVVALVGCAKPSIPPTDGQASAKADPQAGEPKFASDNAESASKPAEKNIPPESARAALSVSVDKSKSEQAKKAIKSKHKYANTIGADIVSGMKEDDYLRKHPGARKSRISSKPEHSVAVYTLQRSDLPAPRPWDYQPKGDQNQIAEPDSSTWFFFKGNLVGLSLRWKSDKESFQNRHREIMEHMGTPDCDKVNKSDLVAREDTPHNYSWSATEPGLFVQYEVTTFTGLSQSITVCSVAGVGQEAGLMGFHANFIEHYKAVAPAKSSLPVGSAAVGDKEKLDYIKKLAPEVVGGYSLDDLYKAHEDAKTVKPTKNPDGSQELIWGNNLLNKQAMIGDGKVLLYRVKVIRADRPAAEKEASRPTALLGSPKSTSVPDDEPDTVSCNVWIEQGYWVRTAVVKGKTVKGGDVYFAETFVINLKGTDAIRKK